MMKFVHALNSVVAYIGMEKFGNAQTVTTQRKTKKKLPITEIQFDGRELFYSYADLSISPDTPDFNSTVQWSGQM